MAPLISIDEWEDLRSSRRAKKCTITLPCCQSAAYPRVSSLGTRHFVHQRTSECDWEPESVEHIKLKADIAQGCADAGWDACTEASGSDWRADVLAVRGQIRIAFEVQLSAQSLEETCFRQNRYKKSDIRGCWLFRKPPPGAGMPSVDLPMFALHKSEQGKHSHVSLGQEPVPVRTFISALLSRRIRFRRVLKVKPNQEVRISFRETRCYKCGEAYHLYLVFEPYVSVCGLPMPQEECELLAFRPEIVRAVRAFAKTSNASALSIGSVGKYWTRGMTEAYPCFRCRWCGAVCGPSYYQTEFVDATYSPDRPPAVFETTVEVPDGIVEDRPHWCVADAQGCFC